MAKEIKLKTSKNNSSVATYLKSAPAPLQADGKVLTKLFEEVTGVKGKMWGIKRKENEHYCSFSSFIKRSDVLAIPNAKTSELGAAGSYEQSELETCAEIWPLLTEAVQVISISYRTSRNTS